MFFFDVGQIYFDAVKLSKKVINIYDVIEKFKIDSKEQDDDSPSFTMRDIKRYFYMIEILLHLKTDQDDFLNYLESINRNYNNLEESILSFDESLETLKMFYFKKYVEGKEEVEKEEEEVEEEGE